jgi:NADPH-dependent F420 reductase
VRVAILGGTGPFGRALAARLNQCGHDVTIGSRSDERAAEVASELGVRGARNHDAAGRADLLVLAVEADSALPTVTELRSFLNAPLLSVASQLEFAAGTARPRVARGRSLAERISELVDVPVIAGLHSLAAGKLATSLPDEDALVCGNDRDAKDLALSLAADVVAGRAVDCGPLPCARALEAMTAVLLNVNRRYKVHAGIRVTGLP